MLKDNQRDAGEEAEGAALAGVAQPRQIACVRMLLDGDNDEMEC